MNPFQVKSPEKITAKEVVSLFVDVFNDFPSLLVPGNTFINGPRGIGKSMMYRYMMPDSQCEVKKCNLNEIDFYGCYLPIKGMSFDIKELDRLRDQANRLVNEHLLCVSFTVKFLSSISEVPITASENDLIKIKEFYNVGFIRLLKRSGITVELEKCDNLDFQGIIKLMFTACEDIYDDAITYCNKLSFTGNTIEYNGGLCSYLNFFHPILLKFCELEIFPNNIYLLIDDADNLNDSQKQVLNTWVSYRLGTQVSLKVSTQMNYNLYYTLSGHTIDSPHDYSEINVSTVYTSSRDKYLNLIKKIVAKRLITFAFPITEPEVFFPEYERQKTRIDEIYQHHVEQFNAGNARGSQKYNDANRYARPDYIKELKSASKQGSSYYYAGFRQLVHLSSGIVRFFLEEAAIMYSEMEKELESKPVNFISPSVQNSVAREYANSFLFDEFEKHKVNASKKGVHLNNFKKLENLIMALGGIFSAILLSNASERRVFSVAIADKPDEELQEVFKLGVQLGYFQPSTIGNKEGTGRTRLYIMSRRLSPVFTLDPTSFAGYKFFRNEELKIALEDYKKFITVIKRKLKLDPDVDSFINPQLDLFE